MEIIAEQPYVKIERKLSSINQERIEHHRTMYLYERKIVTKYHEFPTKDILDISYRYIGGEGGLLYLHTSHGVYSYIVKTSPKAFVQTCKDHLKNNPHL